MRRTAGGELFEQERVQTSVEARRIAARATPLQYTRTRHEQFLKLGHLAERDKLRIFH
jgi:hypothetical protein